MNYTTYKDFLGIDVVVFNDKELIELRNNLDMEYGNIIDDWGKEMAYLVNEKGVDPYTFWGEKKINKAMKKYTSRTADIKNLLEDIEIELEKRDKYKFEQSFIGGKSYHDKTLTKEEFLQKETLKTMKYKDSIETDEEE